MSFFGKMGLSTNFFAFLGKILPLVGLFSVGMTISLFLGGMVEDKLAPLIVAARASHAMTNIGSDMTESGLKKEMDAELRLILQADPFGVPANPIVVSDAEKSSATLEEERVFSVDGIKVVGSLPGVAAWLNEKDKVSLVLLGQTYGAFLLKDVFPYSVVLTKDNVNYEVYISYRDKGEVASSKKRVRSAFSGNDAPVLSSGSKVVAASEGAEGVVARELVDSLLMNPFNELKRVRLIPKFVDDKPVGIEVANIMDGSVLKELGVQKGDVVKSVNGVVIRNMGDVANAINSLMGGTRFEVAVGRGDKEIMLNYVVR